METVPDETGHGRRPFLFSILPVIATAVIRFPFAGTFNLTTGLAFSDFICRYFFQRLFVLLLEYTFLVDLLLGSRRSYFPSARIAAVIAKTSVVIAWSSI